MVRKAGTQVVFGRIRKMVLVYEQNLLALWFMLTGNANCNR